MLTIISKPANSGNYTPCQKRQVNSIVVHLAAGSISGTDNWFANPLSHVSAHYGVSKTGEIHQYVQEHDIAWHAGISFPYRWHVPAMTVNAGENPNLRSIGIEHEGFLGEVWPAAQIQASAALIADICQRYSIPADSAHVVRHSDITAMHQCPGPQCPFDQILSSASRMLDALGKPMPGKPASILGTSTGDSNVR